jgi:hypothetical protein
MVDESRLFVFTSGETRSSIPNSLKKVVRTIFTMENNVKVEIWVISLNVMEEVEQ